MEEAPRDAKSRPDLNHSTKILANHAAVKLSSQEVTASNSMLSSFLYGMPMSSQPHTDGKTELKPTSLHSVSKDRPTTWVPEAEKLTTAKDCADNGGISATTNFLLS